MTTASLKLGGVDILANGGELNILSGVNSNAADINKIGGITNGTVLANKAVVADNNKNVTGLSNLTVTNSVTISGNTITGSEFGPLQSVTLGQSANGKAVTQNSLGRITLGTVGGNQTVNIASHDNVDGGLQLNGELVKASAQEINKLIGLTSQATELNYMAGSSP